MQANQDVCMQSVSGHISQESLFFPYFQICSVHFFYILAQCVRKPIEYSMREKISLSLSLSPSLSLSLSLSPLLSKETNKIFPFMYQLTVYDPSISEEKKERSHTPHTICEVYLLSRFFVTQNAPRSISRIKVAREELLVRK